MELATLILSIISIVLNIVVIVLLDRGKAVLYTKTLREIIETKDSQSAIPRQNIPIVGKESNVVLLKRRTRKEIEQEELEKKKVPLVNKVPKKSKFLEKIQKSIKIHYATDQIQGEKSNN